MYYKGHILFVQIKVGIFFKTHKENLGSDSFTVKILLNIEKLIPFLHRFSKNIEGKASQIILHVQFYLNTNARQKNKNYRPTSLPKHRHEDPQ